MSLINATLVDSEGSSYILDVTPDEANRLRTDITFANKKLREIKYGSLFDEFIAIETSDQNNSLTVEPNENTDKNIETEGNVYKWPHEAILLLIEEYRKRADDFYSGRISQKRTWQNIAAELMTKKHCVTGPQCQSKFGGLKRTYKSIKDHNGKSGNGTRTWAYYDLMDTLIGSKPYISPIATASSSGKRDCETEVNDDQPKKKLNQTPSVDKVIFAIEENRRVSEESRERRHREKFEQKKEALGLLARIVAVLETDKTA